MESKRIELGEEVLWGYRSDAVDEYLTTMQMTAMFARRPDVIRELISEAVAELGRVFGGDVMDGYLTYANHVIEKRGRAYVEERFMKFTKHMRSMSSWAVKHRGRYWDEAYETFEAGENALNAVLAVVQKSKQIDIQ